MKLSHNFQMYTKTGWYFPSSSQFCGANWLEKLDIPLPALSAFFGIANETFAFKFDDAFALGFFEDDRARDGRGWSTLVRSVNTFALFDPALGLVAFGFRFLF